MFYFRYKDYHQFYLSSELYNLILEKNSIVTIKNIRAFFKKTVLINHRIKIMKVNNMLYLITVRFKSEYCKTRFLDYLTYYNELFPPWLVFPNYLNQHISWDQGVQYDYSILTWSKFWAKLTTEQREEYLSKYRCSKEWLVWLENIVAFDENN